LTGIICIWSGSIATVPPGWALCDGTNGTPDLRDRFLVGAGGSESPGATGGSATHNHNFVTNIVSDTHPAGTELTDNSPDGNLRNRTYGHKHGAWGDVRSNIPPSYALCYIMHL